MTYANCVDCDVILRVKNWASTWANQTMGSLGQYGGNFKETAWTACGGEITTGAAEDAPASGGGSRTGAAEDELEGGWSLIMVRLKWQGDKLQNMVNTQTNGGVQCKQTAIDDGAR